MCAVLAWANTQRSIPLQQSILSGNYLYACSLDDNAASVGSRGLMEAIKAVMERHASSKQVSKTALGALRNICVNGTCADLN